MISFDIPTLSLVTMFCALVFAGATFSMWRLVPQEGMLRDWTLCATLLALGNLLVGLRGLIPDILSIAGNVLMVIGVGYLVIGIRGVLGIPVTARHRTLHWMAVAVALFACLYFTEIVPSVAMRIVVVSVLLGCACLLAAWSFFFHADPSLRIWQRLTALLLVTGSLLFAGRAVTAPHAVVSADYASTSSLMVALPYLYSLVLYIWLPITAALLVSARLQHRMTQVAASADAANQAKSEFLATMSHEIRTPMNGVLGMAQLLLMPGISEDERQDYARTLLNSGQLMMTVLNDVLDFSKVEARRLDLAREPFDATAVVSETVRLFSESAQTKGLHLVSSWQGAQGVAYLGDAIRLRQMVSNFLGNAIKFSDAGNISVDAREINRGADFALLEFSVTDPGIGVNTDDQRRLFQPFSQVDGSSTRRHGGSGLGLSIVKGLAELMQGEVGVDSEPGRGSRFWFQVRVGLACS